MSNVPDSSAPTASTAPTSPNAAGGALRRTPLYALHRELGARMVEFAGYEMPVSYPDGILAEHRHCRSAAALFDVSHMGQLRLVGDGAAAALESLMPVDIIDLAVGRQRYAVLTNPSGGILDDLMVTRRPQDLLLVVNAARKEADLKHLQIGIGNRCQIVTMPDEALLALQGPAAALVLGRLAKDVGALRFMDSAAITIAGVPCQVSRSGYTGEDGFEISLPADAAMGFARQLLAQPEIKPAGLGARDTLRLEAGMCLYGHDIDERTTPVEAGLTWAIQKVRRPGGARAGGYPGHSVIAPQLAGTPGVGAMLRRVGLVGLERIPVREGAKLVDGRGHALGRVTSGTMSPTLGKPIAMGYVPANYATPGAEMQAEVRGRNQPLRVQAMPFVPHRYQR